MVRGKAETEAAGAGGKRRRKRRFAHLAALHGGNSNNDCLLVLALPAELTRRKKKVIAKRNQPDAHGTEVQNNISQDQAPLLVMLRGPHRDVNLKLQLALKTTELKQEEIRSLKIELLLKSKEIEDLKAENERVRKAKPQRVKRLCHVCNTYVMHDSRSHNCPKCWHLQSAPRHAYPLPQLAEPEAPERVGENVNELSAGHDELDDYLACIDAIPKEKPQRVKRLCHLCNTYVMNDTCNCPKCWHLRSVTSHADHLPHLDEREAPERHGENVSELSAHADHLPQLDKPEAPERHGENVSELSAHADHLAQLDEPEAPDRHGENVIELSAHADHLPQLDEREAPERHGENVSKLSAHADHLPQLDEPEAPERRGENVSELSAHADHLSQLDEPEAPERHGENVSKLSAGLNELYDDLSPIDAIPKMNF